MVNSCLLPIYFFLREIQSVSGVNVNKLPIWFVAPLKVCLSVRQAVLIHLGGLLIWYPCFSLRALRGCFSFRSEMSLFFPSFCPRSTQVISYKIKQTLALSSMPFPSYMRVWPLISDQIQPWESSVIPVWIIRSKLHFQWLLCSADFSHILLLCVLLRFPRIPH